MKSQILSRKGLTFHASQLNDRVKLKVWESYLTPVAMVSKVPVPT